MPKLLKRYNKALDRADLRPDQEQKKAVQALQGLLGALKTARPFWFWSKKDEVKGVYLHGGVGRGKSMLMDLFFEELPPGIKSRRIHFHEFMIETHDWLHARRGEGMDNLLPAYADHVAAHIKVLCFDEFHVTDVADAMILGRLFTHLFERGLVLVMTSNWAPDRLYEGGLQRALFLPFIELIKQRMEIIHLDSQTDYREA
ncbi:MAG: cell division protein ZapE, partial [Alphaproteobacteria bacterium]|nr:cell division protein ZapE [Alphaproteobacteria bacterium]